MNSDSLRQSVRARLTPEHLQTLTRYIIESHRSGNSEGLFSWAIKAGIPFDTEKPQPRQLFYRLLQLVHPDRLPVLTETFLKVEKLDDLEGMKRLENLLSLDIITPVRTHRISDSFEERREERWDFDGYDDEESRWDDSEDLTFMDAVKLDAVGNIDFEISPFELSQLDGTLDVSRCGLFDLEGVEYCTHISVLDASWNELTSTVDLAGMDNLVELYLAGNSIDDISALTGLSSLEVLDLEDNEVEDVSPLGEMLSLRFVNLRGNPVEDLSVLRSLADAGVLVLF